MCYSATEDFRKALLAGDSQEAIQIFSGCRIRCLSKPYAIYEGSLYPVHCAAQSGSLDLVCNTAQAFSIVQQRAVVCVCSCVQHSGISSSVQ